MRTPPPPNHTALEECTAKLLSQKLFMVPLKCREFELIVRGLNSPRTEVGTASGPVRGHETDHYYTIP